MKDCKAQRFLKYSWKNNLNFSLWSMRKDIRIIVYVVVHELAYIIEMNHSKDSRDLV